MNLRTLSDDEFLRYAHNQVNELTSTAVEQELLRRLESLSIEFDSDAVQAVRELEFTAEELHAINEALYDTSVAAGVKLLSAARAADYKFDLAAELLAALDQAGVVEPDELRDLLQIPTAFRSLANDAGDVFTRLATLADKAIQE